jgi:hypothetical protein
VNPQLHHAPQPISVPLEQLPERLGVAPFRTVEQFLAFHGIAAHIECP